jgi:glycine cleavage system H protein
MGLMSHKVCPNNFDCATCEVDQSLFDEFGTHPILVLAPGRVRRPKQVGHFAVREDRLYFSGHTWIGQAQKKARIGIDDFAQRLIGSVVQATPLVAPGDRVERGDPACEIASARHRTTMRFPMSGRVVRTNPFLKQEPSVLNEDCYNRGWLFVIEPQDYYREARRLVDAERVSKWTQAESDRLFGALSELDGASALSDGGELLPDFSRELSPQGWERIADMFFSSVDADPVL